MLTPLCFQPNDTTRRRRSLHCRISIRRMTAQSKPVVLWSSTRFPLHPPTRHLRVNEYTLFCNGPGDVKFPRVIVTPPSSRFCPWSAPRPPHYAVRRNGEPI